MIASAIFSMDGDVIRKVLPFLPLKFWAFVAVCLVFGVVVVSIAFQQKMFHLRRFWGSVQRLGLSKWASEQLHKFHKRSHAPLRDEELGIV